MTSPEPDPGRSALLGTNSPENAPSKPALPDDEESLTAAESEPSTASTGYVYGALGQPPEPSSIPKPASSQTNGTATTPSTPPPTRALAPDLLRGLLMALMAMDHNVIGLQAWPHSTGANTNEADSAVVDAWNWPFGYAVRTLSHLCAPGFTFLLGMGVAYFGRSRARLGWSPRRMAWHFFVRAVVLTLVSVAMGFLLTQGQFWFMNIVLVALAVDYFLVGMLWLGVAETEPALAAALDRFLLRDDGGERTPLLQQHASTGKKASLRAESISWHVHNAALLALGFVTIWWNHWLSPTRGTCTAAPVASTAGDFWRFWFFQVESPHVVSPFPPLAWLSFAVLGLLYARVVLARPWSVPVQACGNAAAGLFFALLFVLTRVLRIGNLSEGCLHTPDQDLHPDTNPYLASAASFFYIVKYPPDVAFFSFTLAATFLLLAAFGTVPPRTATRRLGVLLAFGTSALFFYLVHMVVLFSLCMLLVAAVGHDTGVRPPADDGRPPRGVDSLWLWWANWAVVVGVMGPLCRRYSAFKKTRGADSVWRFF